MAAVAVAPRQQLRQQPRQNLWRRLAQSCMQFDHQSLTTASQVPQTNQNMQSCMQFDRRVLVADRVVGGARRRDGVISNMSLLY